MKSFLTLSHFMLLAMSTIMPELSASQVGSASGLSSSSSSSASAYATQTITPNTRALIGRKFYELGLQFQNGEGVAKNEKLAATSYKVAAQLGEPMAFLQLGICYTIGIGVSQDIEQRSKLYDRGAALMKQASPTAPHTKVDTVKLPCGHLINSCDLEQTLQGRAEGELPLCPACKKPFKTDQISASLV